MSHGNDLAPPSGPAAGVAPPPSPGRQFYRFLRYSHILTSALRELLEGRFLQQASPYRMSRLQFCLLKLVSLNADLQVGELARCLAVSPGVASKNIDKLERFGLVNRSASPDDRRAILLSVSDEGRRIVQEYERLKAAHIAPAVSELGEEKLDHLCSLLEQVCARLMGEDEGLLERTCLRCAGYYRADCSLGYLQRGCLLHERRATRAGLGPPEGTS